MRRDRWRRLLAEESGFTLSEMMVTVMIMVVVLFALYGIFDMSIRVFSYGNDKIEAVENARAGLERMEREIRGAYPVDSNDEDNRHLFFSANGAPASPPAQMPSATQITFGNDLDGDGAVTCPSAGACEYVTYRLSGSTLIRNATATGSTATAGDQPVVGFVEPNGLSFTYLGSNGAPCAASNATCTGTDESQVEGVRIRLIVKVEGGEQDGTQTLSTDVELRNRDGMSPTEVPAADATPPDTTITAGPASGSSTASTTASFGFTSSETGSTFECRLDAGEWSVCSSPKDYTGLAARSHKFEVRARDAAGNVDATPASRSWTVGAATNEPPVAANDTAAVQKNKSVSIAVLGNDSDPDGDALSITSYTQPLKGTVTQSGDALVYNALNGSDAAGTFTFSYTVNDGKGGTATGTVTVVVT